MKWSEQTERSTGTEARDCTQIWWKKKSTKREKCPTQADFTDPRHKLCRRLSAKRRLRQLLTNPSELKQKVKLELHEDKLYLSDNKAVVHEQWRILSLRNALLVVLHLCPWRWCIKKHHTHCWSFCQTVCIERRAPDSLWLFCVGFNVKSNTNRKSICFRQSEHTTHTTSLFWMKADSWFSLETFPVSQWKIVCLTLAVTSRLAQPQRVSFYLCRTSTAVLNLCETE